MEELSKVMPEPRDKSVTVYVFVDTSNELDNRKRRSHTGCVIFFKRSPIIFYSKLHSTVDSSTFSNEYIAMKTCTEHTMGLIFR